MNITLHVPHIGDSCDFYRGFGPLHHMRSIDSAVENVHYFQGQFSWTTVKETDVAFFLRPSKREDFERAYAYKEAGRLVWVDFDDLLFDVPLFNPAGDHYNDMHTLQVMAGMLAIADVVTCATTFLAAKLQAFTDKQVMFVPNAFDASIQRVPGASSDGKLVVWRGSPSHEQDLAAYGAQIVSVMNMHPEWRIMFMGYDPWRITRTLGDRAKALKPMGHLEYFSTLPRLNAGVCIVPLELHDFNKAKSNIAWIESTMMGAACVAPAWPSWPGDLETFSYIDPKSFEEAFDAALLGEEMRSEKWQRSMRALPKLDKTRASIMHAALTNKERPVLPEPLEIMKIGRERLKTYLG